MKKILILAATCLFLTGCGHNSIQYSDGIGFETTFRPDSGNFGFVFRYGKILSAVVRENTQIQMTGDAGTGTVQNSPNVKTNSILKIKIGEQSTKAKRDCILAEKQLKNRVQQMKLRLFYDKIEKSTKVQLIEDLYVGKMYIPRGFISDGGSIPRLFWRLFSPLDGRYLRLIYPA